MQKKENQLPSLPWRVEVLSYEKWVALAYFATQSLARTESRILQSKYSARYKRIDEPTIYYP